MGVSFQGRRAVGLLLGLSFAVTVTGCASRSVIGEQNGLGGGAGTMTTIGRGGDVGQQGGSGGSAGGGAGTGGAGTGATGGGSVDAAVDGPPAICPACGAHAACVGTGGGASCVCVAGYVASNGACVWDSVLQDPGFQNIPAGAWTLEDGAILDPAAAGYLEPGELGIGTAALCTADGQARQTITMPALADAEPLALKVTSTTDCTTQYGPCGAPGTSVLVNGGAIPFTSGFLSDVSLACLGERAYGGTFDVVVRPTDRFVCAAAKSVDTFVDHLDIEPSATCPMPGTLPDGDFDGAIDNWTTFATADDGVRPPDVAEIQPGTGTDGSSAGHLSLGYSCDYAWISGPISPPLSSIPNLALQLRYRGTAGQSLSLSLGGILIANLPSAGASWTTASVCLPEGSKGMTQSLQIGLVPSMLGGGDGCDSPGNDFLFDDLQFVSDPTCPATAWIADGDFERADPTTALDTAVANNGVAAGAAFAGIDAAAANARSGTHSLSLSNNVQCGFAAAAFAISIPPSAAGGGPALTFYYRAPVLASSLLTIGLNPGAFAPPALAPAGTYTELQLCLDPILSGQTRTVEVKLAGGSACSQTYPTETVWFDDFTVGTSPDCPTN